MPIGKRLLLFALVLILAGGAVICLTPVMVADGIRLFVLWKGHEQGVKISVGQIESPLFQPVVIHRIRVTSVRPSAVRVAIEAPRAELDLNLRALLFRSAGRIVHRFAIDNLRGEVERVRTDASQGRFDWPLFHRLLADDLELTNLNLQVKNGGARFDLRGVNLNVNEIEAGRFTARSIRLSAPWFHQQFTNLRGATAWENEQLTIGALSLAPGLDIETITADLSRLDKKRVGLEVNLDAFGGTLRASVASENRQKGIVWNVAGTATEISLAQMSTALGLSEPAAGSVHASKFTFRGDLHNFSHATASVWMEVSGFTWRDRSADVVMLGASLYNRQVDVAQLYVKQRGNQLTLTGEYALPAESSDWVNPDFRADISASINDLGDFARLFGAAPDSFSGSLSIAGTLNGRDRNIGGRLMVNGESLRLFKAPADSLSAQLNLKGSELTIDGLEMRHGDNRAHASGKVDLTRQHDYSGKLTATMAGIADYWPLLPERWRALQPDGNLWVEWTGHGNTTAQSGDFRIKAQNVQTNAQLAILPFDAQMDGAYSPQNIFFREFRLSNSQADFSAFVTVAPNYLQLQTVNFNLNGKPKLQGNVFIPIALAPWARGGAALDLLDPNLNFDVDLTLDSVDLAELATALTDQTRLTGSLSGRLETYGQLTSLQSQFEAHLLDFSDNEPTHASADLQAQIAANVLAISLSMSAADSNRVKVEASLPLQLGRISAAGRNIFALDAPFSATLDFPVVMMSKLPRALGRGLFHDGILSGKLVASKSLRHPQIAGEAQLVNGKFTKAPGALSGLNGRLIFNGSAASLSFANLEFPDGKIPFRGSLDFGDSARISAQLFPETSVWNPGDLSAAGCISAVNFFPTKSQASEDKSDYLRREIQEVELRGNIIGDGWNITLHENGSADFLASSEQKAQTFPLCRSDGEVLQLGVLTAQKFEIGRAALPIFEGRRTLTTPLNSPPEQP